MRGCRKGQFMNSIEEFEISKAQKYDSTHLLNARHLFQSNMLFKIITTVQGLSAPIVVTNKMTRPTTASQIMSCMFVVCPCMFVFLSSF